MCRTLACLIALVSSLPLGAQTTASVVRLSYQIERPQLVAPGQVVHLTLRGLKTAFDSTQVAQAVPLPTNFKGLSISLQRSGTAQSELLPLLRLDGLPSSCSGVIVLANPIPCTPTDPVYDIWVQIPFDLVPNKSGVDNTGCPTLTCNLLDATLTVTEQSGIGTSLRVLPVIDQVHILNSCSDAIGTVGLEGGSIYASYACVPAITHADGSWVTFAKPAKSGEELVAYAFGLGAPAVPFDTVSGTPPAGVALTQPFTISFPGIGTAAAKPDYVGLVGGSAGLYQVNFHVPSVPANIAPCNGPTGPTQLATNPFNFTMTLLGMSSLDQASFCVQP